jgi:trigger factor
VTFTATHPGDGEPVEFEVTVKEVRETVLPDLDDDFAAQASEFDTLEELRADLRTRLSGVKAAQARMALQEAVAEALAELVEDDPPEPLIESEMQTRLQDLAMRLGAQGIELGDYMRITGQDPEAFRDDLRTSAERSVRVDLALRAVATSEELEVDDDELDAEIEGVAARVGQPPARVREQFERNHQIPLVRSDLRTRKAMDWVLERVEVVDRDGTVLDREALLADPEHDHDHDGHDHDHEGHDHEGHDHDHDHEVEESKS